MEEEISLDVATAKQKVKIFKQASKEVKSKELEIKAKALTKFKDFRYFIDGGCLPPFIEAVAIKKVS